MSSRGLPANVVSELEGSSYSFEYLFEAVFTSATFRFWTGLNNLNWDSKTWLGNGYLQSISGYSEDSSRVESSPIKVGLTGLPTELLYYILNESRQDRTGSIYLVFLDSNDQLLHVEPLFSGILDTADIIEGAASSQITLSYKDPLYQLKAEREARWTPEEHKANYPGDLGFDYVPFLRQQRIYWGRPDTTRQR